MDPRRPERPPDPRAPRARSGDPRLGLPAPVGVVGALAVGIAFWLGGPVAAVSTVGVVVAFAIAWALWRGRGHR